jgi:hypothetical protein
LTEYRSDPIHLWHDKSTTSLFKRAISDDKSVEADDQILGKGVQGMMEANLCRPYWTQRLMNSPETMPAKRNISILRNMVLNIPWKRRSYKLEVEFEAEV